MKIEDEDRLGLLGGSNFFVRPGASEGPITFSGRLGNAQHLGGFSEAQAKKIAELDQLGALRVEPGEFFQRFTNGKDMVGFGIGGGGGVFEIDALLSSAVAN